MLYLTTQHVFENLGGGQLPGCPPHVKALRDWLNAIRGFSSESLALNNGTNTKHFKSEST